MRLAIATFQPLMSHQRSPAHFISCLLQTFQCQEYAGTRQDYPGTLQEYSGTRPEIDRIVGTKYANLTDKDTIVSDDGTSVELS